MAFTHGQEKDKRYNVFVRVKKEGDPSIGSNDFEEIKDFIKDVERCIRDNKFSDVLVFDALEKTSQNIKGDTLPDILKDMFDKHYPEWKVGVVIENIN